MMKIIKKKTGKSKFGCFMIPRVVIQADGYVSFVLPEKP
jgi:hypothetical protein